MTTPTKTLTFKKNSIMFLAHPSVGWCVPAKLIGAALGYANAGQKLNDLVTHSWSKKNWGSEDSKVFTGKELEELKKDTPQYGVALEASSVLFLSMSGVIKILLRSRSKTAEEFRSFLVSKGGELTEGVQMPKRVLQKAPKAPVAAPQVIPDVDGLPPELKGPVALLKQMQSSGLFETEKLGALYLDLWNKYMAPPTIFEALFAGATTPKKKDATQLVPVSNIQASSLTPNFDSIRSFFLTGHQKHPKFPLWISADEIGDTCGKTADQVKTFSTKYAESLGYKLPNVELMEQVKNNGGYFKGVSTMVDENFIPCFANPILGCVAVWYLTEDGKMLWRNYWSPDAVTKIRALMGLPPIFNQPQLTAPTPQVQANAPVTQQN
jgi:hypothetical protein